MDLSVSLREGHCSTIDEVKKLRDQLSLKLLKTLDECTQLILHQTPFVTAYELCREDRWTRAGVEGFLYIISRSVEPNSSFVLVNKKSENHLIEYLTPEFEMKHEGNFIFYRSKNLQQDIMNAIRGLWFFDENECQMAFEKIKSLTSCNRPLVYKSTNIDSSLSNECINFKKDAIITSKAETIINSASQSMAYDKLTERNIPISTTNTALTHLDRNNKSNDKFCYSLTDNTVNLNSNGQRLMDLLRSSFKSDNTVSMVTQPSINHDQKTLKNSLFIDNSFETHVGDTNITINYKMLKTAISQAVNSEDFAALVWEKLGLMSNSHTLSGT